MKIKTTIILIIFMCMASQSFAKVGAIDFDTLIQKSDIIVVAKVESISRSLILIGNRYANAKVIEIWKGPQVKSVEFLASPTWTCDISDANEGEDVLLFLSRGKDSRSNILMHAGRGRMPLRIIGGKTYATFWTDVRLPEWTPTIDGPDPKYKFIKSVELSILKALVDNGLRNNK